VLLEENPWLGSFVQNMITIDETFMPSWQAIIVRRKQIPARLSLVQPKGSESYSVALRKIILEIIPFKLQTLKTMTLAGYVPMRISAQMCSRIFRGLPHSESVGSRSIAALSVQDYLRGVPYSRLQTLSYWPGEVESGPEPLYEWIISSPYRNNIRSLSLMLEIDPPEPHGQLLRELGPLLEHLSLEIEGTSDSHWLQTDEYIKEVDLRPLKKL